MILFFIKCAVEKAVEAFKKGKECYFCDYYYYPISCDMCRDDTCKTNFINRIIFSIKIFVLEYKFIKRFCEHINGVDDD